MCQVQTDYAFQHSKRVLRQQRAERYEGAADLRLWKRAASAAYRAYAVVTPPPLLGGSAVPEHGGSSCIDKQSSDEDVIEKKNQEYIYKS